MIKEIAVFSLDGEKIGKEIFDINEKEKINKDVLYRYVVGYLANQRQGTVSVKTKGDVSGSGKKPWRQKGTGRARVGTTRNPVWRHGGVAFGPKPRDYRQFLPRKMKEKALRDALFSRILDEKFCLVSISPEISRPKTRIFSDFIKKAGFSDIRILFVLDKSNEKKLTILKSLRN
ncbi:MAG: 50S ribosomal protein L4, partial [Candidatus Omnitrophica bacterium]|nr:50S ribosomal protein L4 [Candidatus Omnitrophota bacterium]